MRRLVAYISLFVRNEGSVEAKIRRLRLITEIRQMVGNGRSYREIMDTLGVPERSFYRYLSQTFEHDRQLLAEQDKDKLALELSILHDRLTSHIAG
jgi:Homeodomain-like domain